MLQQKWDPRFLPRIDWRILPAILGLMFISLLVISSMTGEPQDGFWTPYVKSQIRWFILGWAAFAAVASFDYRILRSVSWIFYAVMVLLLLGLFFVPAIQNVHRWYRIPGIGLTIQPSEHAKLAVVIALAAFLERQKSGGLLVSFQACLLVGVPFLLILKQPDLGTALILFPIALAMGYFAGLHRGFIRCLSFVCLGLFALILCLFTGILSHEEMRPVFTRVMKEYQYERLTPDTYHQKAAVIAISVGGVTGAGWKKGEFAGRKWLPAAHTDSVFAAYGEEFGFIGLIILLSLFCVLIYFSLQVAVVARDRFGRLLGVGLAVYLAMHVLLNVGMMCALLPISGVPLIFCDVWGEFPAHDDGSHGVAPKYL